MDYKHYILDFQPRSGEIFVENKFGQHLKGA
jgi:hypothetical protein